MIRHRCRHPQLSQLQIELEQFWGDGSGFVIAGRPLLFMLCDFGTACARGRGRPRSLTPSAPLGLSAVSQISSSCLPSMAGRDRLPSPSSFPLGYDRLSTALRYYAVIRLLSSLRHLSFSSFLATAPSAEAERSPRVRTRNFPLHPRPYALPPTDIGLRSPLAGSPKGRAPLDASLSLGAEVHLRLPPDLPSRARQGCATGKDLVLQIDALVSSVLGSLRQGPMRTFTSCSAHMPGAPDPSSLRSSG